MEPLTIIGRRWFDKINGNTYHSVEIWQGGKMLVRVPFAYGYGNQYQQTALIEAVKLGLYPGTPAKHGGFEAYRQFVFSKKSGGDGHTFSVSDVRRKKDL
jgi:hypothetical protein